MKIGEITDPKYNFWTVLLAKQKEKEDGPKPHNCLDCPHYKEGTARDGGCENCTRLDIYPRK